MEYVDRHNSDFRGMFDVLWCNYSIRKQITAYAQWRPCGGKLHYQVEDLSKQCNEEERQQQTKETSDWRSPHFSATYKDRTLYWAD